MAAATLRQFGMSGLVGFNESMKTAATRSARPANTLDPTAHPEHGLSEKPGNIAS